VMNRRQREAQRKFSLQNIRFAAGKKYART
jgi:hypothetical protein